VYVIVVHPFQNIYKEQEEKKTKLDKRQKLNVFNRISTEKKEERTKKKIPTAKTDELFVLVFSAY
jgi:hypothetical protein